MKKLIYAWAFNLTAFLLFFSANSAFAQSITILPERTVLDNNSWGDNIKLSSNSAILGIQSLRFNGTISSKLPVLQEDELFRIGGGGYYNSSNIFTEKAAIFFRASQDWNTGTAGTKIAFMTTANNTTGLTERMMIDHNGNVGINNVSPTAKLHINHLASSGSPHLQLNSTGTSSSIIKTTSTTGNSWENHFLSGATAGTNLVYWTNSVNSATPLILTGDGDAIVEKNTSIGGYTNLGTGAPKIKMKQLSINTSVTAGGVAYVAHGVALEKILSVSILVNASTGHDFPPSYGSTTATGFQYFYFITSTHVVIENSMTSYTNIANRPARILVTYKE
ncbi:MAG TPA: hypothetical protein VGE24_11915 [Emticicia sp.]